MFCSHCGVQIQNNARFCPHCGGKTEEDINNCINSDQKSDLIFKCSRSTQSALVFQLLLGAFFIIGCIVGIVLMQSFVKEPNRGDSDSHKWIWVVFLNEFIAIELLVMINRGAKLAVVTATYLCISEDGIIGVGGTPSYLGKLSFNYKYKHIRKVTTVGEAINIVTIGGDYKLLLEDPGRAIRELNKRLEKTKAEFI